MRPVATSLHGSTQPLTQEHDVALLDLDGVVYVGPDAVPGAAEALATAREQGMSLAFVTNNAARTPHAVADHLTDLGIAARTSEIVTSAQAAARYLSDHLPGGARVLVVGAKGLEEALRERGLTPVLDAQGQVDAVAQGHSPDMNWRLLAEGAIAINRGALWVATNADPTIPSSRGPLPGNGSLVAALRHATRVEPVVTGKPDPTMHRETVLRTGAKRPIVVGDRLDTDIEGANAVGCPSLLVFSGVTTPRDLLAASPKLRPTYIAPDLGGLLIEHPEPKLESNEATCGRWRVEQTDSGFVLSRADTSIDRAHDDPGKSASASTSPDTSLDADAMDALRALCTAWWGADSDEKGRADGLSESAAEVSRAGGQPSPRLNGEFPVEGKGAGAASMVRRLGLAS